jgi:hypothetical protein
LLLQKLKQRLFYHFGGFFIQCGCRFYGNESLVPIRILDVYIPSNRSTCALGSPIASASATLWVSPPLNVDHVRSHAPSGTPQLLAISIGSSTSELWACESWRDLKERRVSRKALGVDGSIDGRWGTYCTSVLYFAMPGCVFRFRDIQHYSSPLPYCRGVLNIVSVMSVQKEIIEPHLPLRSTSPL